jgi:hypothetical protein
MRRQRLGWFCCAVANLRPPWAFDAWRITLRAWRITFAA